MKKMSFVYVMLLFPLLSFSQRKAEDFFNNRIDFVLDNNYGRAFMGGIVNEYIKTDSLNHFYSKTGIHPFYKYIESKYFDKKFLESTNLASEDRRKAEYYNIYKTNSSGGICEYNLELYPHRNFLIKSEGYLEIEGHPTRGRYSYYEPFANFELSMNKTDGNKNKITVNKILYSNASLKINGIDLYSIKYFENINFFNTLTINYTDCNKCANCKNKDECLSFSVIIYETISMDGPYVEGNNHYLGSYPNITMRKVEITGNKEEAIKYLKENKLDYIEIKPEDYKKDFFIKKDK